MKTTLLILLASAAFMLTCYGQDDRSGKPHYPDHVNGTVGIIPFTFSIGPNPCRSVLKIRYELPYTGPVRIAILNSAGQKTGTILNETQQPGAYELFLYPDQYNFSPGQYIVQFIYDRTITNRKVLYIK